MYTVSAMQLHTGDRFGSKNAPLLAQKAVFFLDDGFVALGTNITGDGNTDVSNVACTQLDQTVLR